LEYSAKKLKSGHYVERLIRLHKAIHNYC